MDYTYKNCDNKCLVMVDRVYYLCSMYNNCKNRKLPESYQTLVIAFLNIKKVDKKHGFIDLLDIVRAKVNRKLTEKETKLISKLYEKKC